VGRKALGLAALVVFTCMQPQLACGVHCALFGHHGSADGGMEMDVHSPFPGCHHGASLINGHIPALSEVQSAPPAARVEFGTKRAPVVFTGGAPGVPSHSVFLDPERPPPRA